jgi:hypothetical protein
MLWFGSPCPGATMWSIVQSLPSSSLPHVAQSGSRTFFAASLALIQALEECQSATVFLVEQDVCSYGFHGVEYAFDVCAWFQAVGCYFIADPFADHE